LFPPDSQTTNVSSLPVTTSTSPRRTGHRQRQKIFLKYSEIVDIARQNGYNAVRIMFCTTVFSKKMTFFKEYALSNNQRDGSFLARLHNWLDKLGKRRGGVIP